jgi:flagellar hook assembly protein FlgD
MLYQNYPNPFYAKTKIRYYISNYGKVVLKVYNRAGIEVTTLVNKNQPSGTHEVEFDGSRLSRGIYYYRLITENYIDSKKFVLFN